MKPTEDHDADRATLSHLRIATRELVLFIREDSTDVLVNQPDRSDEPEGGRILQRWAAALQSEGWEIARSGSQSVGLRRARTSAARPRTPDSTRLAG